MKKPTDLPKAPGVYMLLCPSRLLAYVGKCANVRHRAAIWSYHFRKLEKDPTHKMPVRGWPCDTPEVRAGDAWEFGTTAASLANLKRVIDEAGYTLIRDTVRAQDDIEFGGVKATLAQHCRTAGVPYSRAYARFKAGKPLAEVFAKE